MTTPRTDNALESPFCEANEHFADFARDLERELAAVTKERDALLRGEYVCKKCGIRKDGEGGKGDF